jgi:hypothetical protein
MINDLNQPASFLEGGLTKTIVTALPTDFATGKSVATGICLSTQRANAKHQCNCGEC